jgi:predicted acylesterase/phospholipase RssA
MSFARALRALALTAALLGGCASDPRASFTESEEMTAVAIGAPNIRYWADATASAIRGSARPAVVQNGRPFVYLALSGGGGGGAFGAGVLNGWSESGTRPEFTIVSGVSTGALIAPFAFLGPDYDDRLRQIYTNG